MPLNLQTRVGNPRLTHAEMDENWTDIQTLVNTLETDKQNATYTPAGTGADARTIESRLNETVSVKDFGAVGDGSTDDRDKIQDAINSLTSGGTVYFPPGTYICQSTFTIPSNITLQGNGSTSIIKAGTSLSLSSPLFRNSVVGSYTNSNITIRDLIIDGNDLSKNAGTQERFTAMCQLVRVTNVAIFNTTFRNFGYIGLNLGGVRKARIIGCKFTGMGYAGTTANGGPAVWCTNTTTEWPKDVKFIGCEFHDNNWHGIHFSVVEGVITGCSFRDNQETHIFTATVIPEGTGQLGRHIVISNNTFIGMRKHDISAHGIEVGMVDGLIVNNHIEDCDHGGIALTDCKNVIVANNTIKNVSKLNVYSGIDVINLAASPNNTNNIDIINNRIFDDQGTPTTRYGISFSGANASTNVSIRGNDLSNGNFTLGTINIPTANWTPSTSNRKDNKGTGDVKPFIKDQSITGTGSTNVTGVPFTPSGAEVTAVQTSTTSIRRSDAHLSKGLTPTGSTIVHEAAGTRNEVHSKAWRIVDGAGTVISEADFTSFNIDGMTVNVTTHTGTITLRMVFFP